MTTAAGTPAADNQNSETAGPRGPVLMQDYQLVEKMAHFNRERVADFKVDAGALAARAETMRQAGQTVMFAVADSQVAGLIGVADTVKANRGRAARSESRHNQEAAGRRPRGGHGR